MSTLADRVKDHTSSTGTGAITLDDVAPTGFRTFAAAFSSGSTLVNYCIDDGVGNWEVGSGTFNGTTGLNRASVFTSSNNNELVNFAAGSKTVFCTAPASVLLTKDNFPQQAPTASAPAWVKGAVYFDTTLNKLMFGGQSRWELVTSSMQMDHVRFVAQGVGYGGALILGSVQMVVGASNGSVSVILGQGPLGITSTDNVTWTRNESLTTATANSGFSGEDGDINWNGSQFLAVAAQTCATSPDGLTWTKRTGLNTASASKYWTAVNWNGSQYLAVAENGHGATSPDGITWTSRTDLTTALGGSHAYVIAWSGSQYVVAGAAGKSATSPDGITWTSRTGLVTATGGYDIISMAYGGGNYCVTANNQIIYRSTDGITWTGLVSTGWNFPDRVVWDGSKFIASGWGHTATSTDGAAWTQVGTGIDTQYRKMFTYGTTYISGSNTGGRIAVSTDSGSTWSYPDVVGGIAGAQEGRAVIWDGTKWIVSGGTSSTTPFLINSTDGVNWVKRPSAVTALGGTYASFVLAANATTAVIANDGPGQGATSSDHGNTWTVNAGIQAAIPNSAIFGAGWNGSQFLMVGGLAAAAKAITSPDGITWTSQATNFAAAFKGDPLAVCWSGSQWVVVGSLGKCATSPDGINWTSQTGLSDAIGFNTLYAIASNGFLLMAVGLYGRCATSPDGVIWTNQLSLSILFAFGSNSANAVCYNGQGFVVAGTSGSCAYSPDGVAWLQVPEIKTIFGSDQIYALGWNGTKMIAVGSNGKAAIST